MRIRLRLSLLLVTVITAFTAVAGFLVIQLVPTEAMKTEKESLFLLNEALLNLRIEVNRLDNEPIGDQIDLIEEKYQKVHTIFYSISDFTLLYRDEQIAGELDQIREQVGNYQTHYSTLFSSLANLYANVKSLFSFSNIPISAIRNSDLLKEAGESSMLSLNLERVRSSKVNLDRSLDDVHSRINNQFEKINAIIKQREQRAYLFSGILFLSMVLLSILFSIRVTSSLSRDIETCSAGIRKMATGSLQERFKIPARNRELFDLGNHLNSLMDGLSEIFRSMKTSADHGVEIKEELLTSTNQSLTASNEIYANSDSIKKQVLNLKEVVSASSSAMENMKTRIQSLGLVISTETEMQESSAASISQMISSISHVAEITERKKSATTNLVHTAAEGGERLEETARIIQEINNNIDEIRESTSLIHQIASQTNLLAMNAAIEAAHAGKAGKGFAVVADEIRKLAEASSRNSRRISGTIETVVNRIQKASDSGDQTLSAFHLIKKEVTDVSESFEEITANMTELNNGGNRILEDIGRLKESSKELNHERGSLFASSNEVVETIDTVSRVSEEVAQSALEINLGIKEINVAMTLLSSLSEGLGEITLTLKEDAGRYRSAVKP